MKITHFLCFFIISNVTFAEFSTSYEEARHKFKQTVKKHCLNCKEESFRVPGQIDNNLWVDAAINHPEQRKNLIILVSGVHGPEGFAGNAAQILFLKKYKKWPLGTGLLLIHGVNPFGMKYGRRVSENNVNLNRNLSLDKKIFTQQNQNYLELAHLFNPKVAVINPWSERAGRNARLLTHISSKQQGLGLLLKGYILGQYEYSKGIEFGGKDWEPQSIWLMNLLKENIQLYENILLLDLHTGVGKKDHVSFLTGSDQPASSLALIKKWLPTKMKGFELISSDQKRFYESKGDLSDFIFEISKQEQKIASLTVEFGTRGSGVFSILKGFQGVIQENQGWHYGYKNKKIKNSIEHTFKTFFNPPSKKWQRNVIEHSENMFKHILENFGN